MSRHGCLPTTFKFTGWIIVLLQLAVIIPVVITLKKVPPETKVYVDDGLYQHRRLIQDYPRLYVKQLFRHFEAHFVAKGIGDWHHSRWPQLLQDLDLLPEQYKVTYVTQYRFPLSVFWTDWHGRPEREAAPPLNSQVRIPVPLMCLFDGEGATGTIRYGEVLAAAQDIVDNQYDIYAKNRKTNLIKNALIKKYRVLAFFGLTVFDQFLGAVENQTGTSLETQVPRTRWVPEPVAGDHPRAEQVAPAQAQPRPAEPNLQPVPPQMANPTGGRRGVNSGEGAAVPMAPPQAAGGPSSGSGGVGANLEHMSPAEAPNSGSNKGIVPAVVALQPWQVIGLQILGSKKEPILRRDIYHYPDQAGGSNRGEGVAGPLGPGTSGGGGVGGNAAAARAPNREAKRKATDQGGGPSHGGNRGPGGAMMRSMVHVHKAHHHARKFKSGTKFHRGHGLRA